MKAHAGQINSRRIKVLLRLESQLKLGVKQPKGSFLTLEMIPLTPEDVNRIKQEIISLKGKIVSVETARSHKPKKYRAIRA